MYLLVEKADIYATQIDIAVAGRLLDASLQRRLERLYSLVHSPPNCRRSDRASKRLPEDRNTRRC